VSAQATSTKAKNRRESLSHRTATRRQQLSHDSDRSIFHGGPSAPPPRRDQDRRDVVQHRSEHPPAADELHHPDHVLEMPQSGERIRGQENLRAFRAADPNPPIIQPRRLVGAGNLWVVEAVRTDDSGQLHVVAVIEFRDGKIWRDTRWFGDPFHAPPWRAQWVEGMEEAPAPEVT
jgi:hypothetical protein